MHRTVATLTRFAALVPDRPMPNSLAELELSEQMLIQQRDPELHQLLSGRAPAALEAAVLSGAWPTAAPSPEQQADTARQQRIAELVELQPFGVPGRYEGETYIPAQEGNLTAALQLEALDPQLAAQLRTAATPPVAQPGLTAEGAQFVNTQLFAAHLNASAA